MDDGELRLSWGRLLVGETGEYGLPPVMVELLSRMLSRGEAGRACSALVGVALDSGEGERGEWERPLRCCVGEEGERELGEEERMGTSLANAVYVVYELGREKAMISKKDFMKVKRS